MTLLLVSSRGTSGGSSSNHAILCLPLEYNSVGNAMAEVAETARATAGIKPTSRADQFQPTVACKKCRPAIIALDPILISHTSDGQCHCRLRKECDPYPMQGESCAGGRTSGLSDHYVIGHRKHQRDLRYQTPSHVPLVTAPFNPPCPQPRSSSRPH